MKRNVRINDKNDNHNDRNSCSTNLRMKKCQPEENAGELISIIRAARLTNSIVLPPEGRTLNVQVPMVSTTYRIRLSLSECFPGHRVGAEGNLVWRHPLIQKGPSLCRHFGDEFCFSQIHLKPLPHFVSTATPASGIDGPIVRGLGHVVQACTERLVPRPPNEGGREGRVWQQTCLQSQGRVAYCHEKVYIRKIIVPNYLLREP